METHPTAPGGALHRHGVSRNYCMSASNASMYNLALRVGLGRQLRLPVAESMLLIVDRLRARLSQSGDGTKLSAQTREERSPLKSISPALKLALAGLRLDCQGRSESRPPGRSKRGPLGRRAATPGRGAIARPQPSFWFGREESSRRSRGNVGISPALGEISKGLVERVGSLPLAFHAFHSPGISTALSGSQRCWPFPRPAPLSGWTRVPRCPSSFCCSSVGSFLRSFPGCGRGASGDPVTRRSAAPNRALRSTRQTAGCW
jgi:hypothetical protein